MNSTSLNKQHGFTLLEIVLVLILIGILSAVATIKLTGSSTSMIAAQQTVQIVAALKHTQFLALNWGCNLRAVASAANFQVKSNSAIAGKPCAAIGAAIADPSSREKLSTFSINLSSGSLFQAAYQIDYDSYGRPNNNGVLLTTAYLINITSGATIWHISIAPITGFISVTKT